MGKRKSKRKAPPKRQLQKLDKEFNCPICCSDKTVEVHLNHKAGIANTLCRSCRQTFETSITPIDAEIDVYAAWVDAVEDGTAQQTVLAEDLAAIPQQQAQRGSKGAAPRKRQRTAQAAGDADEEEEEDDDEEEEAVLEDDGDDADSPFPSRPPAAPARPPDIENEIELPEEEEEYDFGDNNEDDDDASSDAGGAAPPPEPTWD